MSELDSLSDNEWLEISSNQSDNDSLSDSSRSSGLPSEPPSRRSSISLGSSVDGQIDAWEGFADDNFPDDSPEELVPHADPEVANVPAAEQAGPHMPDSVAEEQFVNAALEQSLVGTLSASRSSSLGVSGTVHNSLRDLRLSFPDPITSSRDELNRSYEAVSSSEAHCITDDDSNSPMTTEFPGNEPPLHGSPPPLPDQLRGKLESLSGRDPLPTLVHWRDGRQIKEFDLVLYGSTSQSREFAQWLLSVLVTGGVVLSYNDDSLRRLSPKTTGNGGVVAPSSQTSDRPSLAIVSLPASFGRLPHHTVYLPVIFPAKGISVLGDLDVVDSFESWSLLDEPPVRTLRLIKDSESQVVVDGMEMRNMVDPQFVYRELFGTLLPSSAKKPLGLERTVTFVGLLLMIMGFTANTLLRTPTPAPTPAAVSFSPAQTTPSTFWNMFGTTLNSSVVPLSTAVPTSNMAIMPSTLKEMALAIFNPATTTPVVEVTSLSVALAPSDARASRAPTGECKPKTRSEKYQSTKDVIVRPPTSLSNPASPKAPPTHTPSVGGNIGKVTPLSESVPVTSLSLKFVDSLSEVVDATMKALEEVVGRDFRELMMALNDLMRAISHQATAIVADSKSRAKILRARLHHRNERAKGKARELKQTAEQFVASAGKRLKARADIAKTRAQTLKQSFMATSMWRTYAQAHGEWIEKLEVKKGKRRERKREHKSLFTKIKEKRAIRAHKKRAST